MTIILIVAINYPTGSALIQGAITDILTQTPQSFYDDTVKVVEVRISS